MRRIIVLTMAGCLLSPTALAEMPYPKKPYSAKLEVTAEGKTAPADMFISGPKIRMEMTADEGPAAGQKVTFVADRKTGEAFTLADMDGRKMAIKMDINKAMEQINFVNQDLGQALGKKWIGFKRCTNYKTMTGTTCLTKDNIVLEAYDDDRYMKVRKIKMGKQNPELFQVPSGYQVMDLGGMMSGLGGFLGGDSAFNLGGFDLGNFGNPMEIGKALSEDENVNGEGFNSIMKNLGLPTEDIDTSGEAAFAKTLDKMIRNEVKGTNAEGIINGDLSESEEFRKGLEMRDEMTKALENGEDPLSALMKRNGVSDSELADFRQQGKEIEALNAPGGFIDQQIERADVGRADQTLDAELKKLEAIQDEMERLMSMGKITDEDRARFDKETKDIEQRIFRAMQGQ